MCSRRRSHRAILPWRAARPGDAGNRVTGRVAMTLMLSMSIVLSNALGIPAWAEGFPGGIGDALGPFYQPAPGAGRAPIGGRAPGPKGASTARDGDEVASHADATRHTPR